jgi:diacylglycerol kinase family enzyme
MHVVMARRPDGDNDELARRLRAHPGNAGRRVRFHVPAQPAGLAQVAGQAARAALGDGGVVVAVGGDGTVNTVSQACWPLGVPMGVLAQGTFNFFCRAQRLPEAVDDALTQLTDALRDGQLRAVQVGQVNGQVFLVNASLGLYPRLLADREAASARWGRYRLVALLAGAATLLRPHFGQRLMLAQRGADGSEQHSSRQASTVFVGNNALQLANVGLPEAQDVRQGALGVVTLAPRRPWAMLQLLWRAWRGRLADDPAVDNFACRSLTVSRQGWRGGARITVAFDGERRVMSLPVQFAVGERPLWLVAPPMPAVATGATVPAPGAAAHGQPATAALRSAGLARA